MQLKNLISKYIYLKSFLDTNYEKLSSNNLEETKQILENNLNKKSYSFYILNLSQEKRAWQSNICLSLSEVKALKAFYTNKQNKKNLYLLELEDPKKSEIIKLSLDDILKDDKLIVNFVKRIKLIPKYKKENLLNINENSKIQILWNFSHRLEAKYFYYEKNSFIFDFYEDKKVPFYIDRPYIEVINDQLKYGLIYKQKDKLELIYKCKYNYIETKGILAQIQKNKIVNTKNFKDFICSIVNLQTKDIYSKSALCNTLNEDSFIEICKNKKLRYIKIDNKTYKISAKSKKYDYIINSSILREKPVFNKKERLWGYINKDAKEIISPRFKEYGIFNSGYAIINEDKKYIVINKNGKIIIENKEFIKSFKNDIFFVKKDQKYAIYRKNKIIVDFLDVNEELEKIKKEQDLDDKGLLKYLKKAHRRKTYQFTQEKDPVFLFLELELINKKTALIKNKYKLSLKEYIKQFKQFEEEIDLNTSGLINHKVRVKNCKVLKKYMDIIAEANKGSIGFQYPISASMFDMKKELPVQFIKTNNETLTLGIEFKYLELVK